MSEIREFIFNEPLFDTHDHQLGYDQEWDKKGFDEFLVWYASDDLAATGNSLVMGDTEKLFDIWRFARTTGYGQAVEIAVKILFDMDFTISQADAITEAMQIFIRGKSPHAIYDELYGLANIKWVVNDNIGGDIPSLSFFSGDNFPAFFKGSMRFGRDTILTITKKSEIEQLEKSMNWSIHSLTDLDGHIDEYTEKAIETGNLVSFKNDLAYSRDLDFEDIAFCDAERVFDGILKGKKLIAKPLHDYLAHRIFKRAEYFDIPVQLHTGYLAGNWCDFRLGDPAPLLPVFQKYRKVKFILFHAGFPFSEFTGAVAKEFPNVWIDLCWAWAMNPIVTERLLDEWLSCLPCNKIFGFGADTLSPFPVIGYAHQARNGIANLMEKKLGTGEYDFDTAMFVSRRIMYENAIDVFQM